MFVEKRWAFMVSLITQFGNYFENQGCFSFTYIIYYMFSGQWTLMTLLNPTFVYNLICIGYPGDPSSAIRVTSRRHADRNRQHSERNVLQCFVFGPMKAGKSALLNSLIGRYFSCYLEVPRNTFNY
jgi:hypothetical protein